MRLTIKFSCRIPRKNSEEIIYFLHCFEKRWKKVKKQWRHYLFSSLFLFSSSFLTFYNLFFFLSLFVSVKRRFKKQKSFFHAFYFFSRLFEKQNCQFQHICNVLRSFCQFQHGCNNVVNIISFSMAGMCPLKIISFSISVMRHFFKYNFQHVRNVLVLRNVSFWNAIVVDFSKKANCTEKKQKKKINGVP
jgi:hypothetical protein